MSSKVALITGITGQDGAYLAEFLLSKNYQVHGIRRRVSVFNTERIDHLIENKDVFNKRFFLHYGDLTDSSSLNHVVKKVMPDEIYNLAAQSHVAVSFEAPEYTANSDALGTLRLLEIIRTLNKKIKFYQASTSELFGKVVESPQNENTPFYPRSPYGAAKLYAYWITVNYREAYNLFACNGILFNHESPKRGEIFVTQKIVQGLVKIKLGLQRSISLGNLDSKRDWGHARDYVQAMWQMLQTKKPQDLVISTGKQYSVRDFLNLVSKKLDIKIEWSGKNMSEKGSWGSKNIIKIDKKYFRPTEVETLLGDSRLAKKTIKWKAKTSINELIDEMVDEALNKFQS